MTWWEACPDCVEDPDELLEHPGQNVNSTRTVLCDTCGGSGLVQHDHGKNAGDSEMC